VIGDGALLHTTALFRAGSFHYLLEFDQEVLGLPANLRARDYATLIDFSLAPRWTT